MADHCQTNGHEPPLSPFAKTVMIIEGRLAVRKSARATVSTRQGDGGLTFPPRRPVLMSSVNCTRVPHEATLKFRHPLFPRAFLVRVCRPVLV